MATATKKAPKKSKKVQLQLVGLSTNLSGNTRHDRMEGREYLVAPMVMIVEGVLNGSDGPLLYPADELAKFPGTWNHKPVVVYHPQINGQGVSACDPDILTNHKVGVIMNTKFEDGKLKAEAWLEKSRMDAVDERVSEAVENNAMMELSTGLFVEVEKEEGEFNGREYSAIARNYRPDHLAILPDLTGACSIKDGAGFLRLNAVSHRDLEDQLRTAVQDTIPEESNAWIVDVFPDIFIYERDSKLYQQDYSVKEDQVLITGTPTEVVRRYEYVVANGQKRIKVIHYEQKESTMDKEKVINELIEKGTWLEDDREFLMAQNDEQLKHLQERKISEPQKLETKDESKLEANNEPQKKDDVVAPVDNNKDKAPQTAEEYISNAPADIQEVLNSGLSSHNELRGKLIEHVLKNEKNILTKEQLAGKKMDDLKALAALCDNVKKDIGVPDYSGQAGVASNTKQEALELPVMNFGPEK